MNVVEVDAASRNGVEDFRRIIEEIAYPPSEGKKKVYIIDEVHMLSTPAFNAFLKTLEEPPEYAVFILATTDPQKLLPTVLSRCQRFDFRRIPVRVIEDRLREVFQAEGIEAQDEAIHSIARRAEGGLRDALSIADRCVSFFPGEKLTGAHILEVLGTAQTSVWRSMLDHAVKGDASGMICQFNDMLMDGKDVRQIISDFTWFLRDLLIFKASGGSSDTDHLVEEDREQLLEDAGKVDERQIMYYIEVLSELTMSLRNSANRRVLAEIALINLCRPQMNKELSDSVQARLSRLETAMEEGAAFACNMPAASGFVPGAQGVSGYGVSAAGAQNADGAGSAARPGVQTAAGQGLDSVVRAQGIPESGAGSSKSMSSGAASARGGQQIPGKEMPTVVVPELFQRIAAQWKQTMSMLPDRGRSEVLAGCGEVSFSREEPDTLFISMDDNWYQSLGTDQVLMQHVSDAIARKYGVRPRIRFVNRAQGQMNGLRKVESTAAALNEEGINFTIDVETDDP